MLLSPLAYAYCSESLIATTPSKSPTELVTMLALVVTQLLALSLVSPARADEVTCWAPDGKTRGNNETYVPCNKLGITSDNVFSSCCALDGNPDKRDLCTVNGLCSRGNVLTRGYCTDKNWESEACVNVCTDPEVCYFFWPLSFDNSR